MRNTESRLYRTCVRPSLLRRCITVVLQSLPLRWRPFFPHFVDDGVLRGFFIFSLNTYTYYLLSVSCVLLRFILLLLFFPSYRGARRDHFVEFGCCTRLQRHAPLFPVRIVLPQPRSLYGYRITPQGGIVPCINRASRKESSKRHFCPVLEISVPDHIGAIKRELENVPDTPICVPFYEFQ